MVATSYFLFEDNSSLTFFRRGKKFLLKNEKQVTQLMREFYLWLCSKLPHNAIMQQCNWSISDFLGDVLHTTMLRIHNDCARCFFGNLLQPIMLMKELPFKSICPILSIIGSKIFFPWRNLCVVCRQSRFWLTTHFQQLKISWKLANLIEPFSSGSAS